MSDAKDQKAPAAAADGKTTTKTSTELPAERRMKITVKGEFTSKLYSGYLPLYASASAANPKAPAQFFHLDDLYRIAFHDQNLYLDGEVSSVWRITTSNNARGGGDDAVVAQTKFVARPASQWKQGIFSKYGMCVSSSGAQGQLYVSTQGAALTAGDKFTSADELYFNVTGLVEKPYKALGQNLEYEIARLKWLAS